MVEQGRGSIFTERNRINVGRSGWESQRDNLRISRGNVVRDTEQAPSVQARPAQVESEVAIQLESVRPAWPEPQYPKDPIGLTPTGSPGELFRMNFGPSSRVEGDDSQHSRKVLEQAQHTSSENNRGQEVVFRPARGSA